MSSRDRLKALFRSDGAFWIGLGIAFLLYSFVVMPLIQGRQRSPLLAVIPICCIIAGGIMLFRPEWKNRLIGAVGAVLAVLSIYAMVAFGFNWILLGSLLAGLWLCLLLLPSEDLDTSAKESTQVAEGGAEESEQSATPPRRRHRKKRKRVPTAEVFEHAQGTRLVEVLFHRVLRHHGDPPDFEQMNEPERDLLLAYHALGIIGNGGFNYLFENRFPSDPDFSHTLAAYERIGAVNAAGAFREVQALFPGNRIPKDINERLQIYRSGPGDRRHAIDCRFWDAREEIEKSLETYLRARRDAFAHLDGPPRQRPVEEDEDESAEEVPAEVQMLRQLPHWARVAFAARCGRRVLPALRANWPEVRPERERDVINALELAEQSARQGQPVQGLDDAAMNATITAGAAMMGLYGAPEGIAGSEPFPLDGNAAGRAAAVAKTAESAARAADSPPEESLEQVFAALHFAFSATEETAGVRQVILGDLAELARLAQEQRWDDATAIPAEVWNPAR